MITSESIKSIAPAFMKFQATCPAPVKTATNTHTGSTYAPLDAILEVVVPTLTDNKLFFTQDAIVEPNQVSVKTIVRHECGEFFEFTPMTLPIVKNTAQGIGSATTYARRYSLTTALGIAAQEDDDGNEASKGGQGRQQPKEDKGQALRNTIDALIEDIRGDKSRNFILSGLAKRMNTKSPFTNWSISQLNWAIELLTTPKEEKKADEKEEAKDENKDNPID
jgi:hypothetical protein